jgi:hypothetical protein
VSLALGINSCHPKFFLILYMLLFRGLRRLHDLESGVDYTLFRLGD